MRLASLVKDCGAAAFVVVAVHAHCDSPETDPDVVAPLVPSLPLPSAFLHQTHHQTRGDVLVVAAYESDVGFVAGAVA